MDEVLTESLLKRSVELSVKDLPALPAVVLKIVHETSLAEPCAHRVEEFLSADQGLAAKLLRVVNSAYYGLQGQVTSIQQAIVILGMQQVRNLALSIGALSVFEAKTPAQQETLRKFWTHSFSTATATQIIARHKRLEPRTAQTLFVGGLLHDIGRLFLFTHFGEQYDRVIDRASRSGKSVELVESQFFGMNHAAVGKLVCEQWKLPKELTHLIGGHEGPFTGKEDELLIIVHVADAITKHLYYRPPLAFDEVIDPVAERWLEMSADEMDAAKAEIAEKVDEAADSFGLIAA